MSDIWHTKKEKPIEDKTIFAQHKSFRDGSIEYFMWEKQEFTDAIRKDVIAWCYLDDLLALETKLIRTRKALETAVDALKEYTDEKRYDWERCYEPHSAETAKKAIEQITALEQKD